MKISNDGDAARSKSRGMFNWEIKLGDVLVAISLLAGAFGLYTTKESRDAVIETRLVAVEQHQSVVDQQNLPPRVSALEVQMGSMRDGFKLLHDDLTQIRNSLDTKADKRN